MTYLLDTNACIALINGNPRGVRRRLDRVFGAGASAAVSAVTAFELWYGAAKSKRRETHMRRLETFFAGPLDLLPFEPGDAHAAGAIRSGLESAGKPIGAYDVLIASPLR